MIGYPDQRHRRKRLLVLGWYRPGTGFTRVLAQLTRYLAEDADVVWIGIGAEGEARDLDSGVRLLPVQMGRGDPVGAYLAAEHWSEIDPDAVFAYNDLWYLEHYARVLGPILGRARMLGYLPLDGEIPEDLELPDLRAFDGLATFTKHAARDLQESLRRQGQVVPVSQVGHGIERAHFRLDASISIDHVDAVARALLAQQYFGLNEPSFVVLNAARPDPRKRIDRCLSAFADFASGRAPNVRLCLHHAFSHAGQTEVMQAQVAELGLAERILWWPRVPGPISDADLNDLYNACAVGINTSAGEGFGLVSFEHAACAVPQIVPDHAALRELWGDAALRAPVQPVITDHSPLRMGLVDTAAVARALTRLYEDPAHYRHAARAAWMRTRAPDLDWRAVASQLAELLWR